MAFVRQRRDVNDEMFTDMDRTRRQQAFIASLVARCATVARVKPQRDAPTCSTSRSKTSPSMPASTWRGSSSARRPHRHPLSLYTLPITEFGQDSAGEDINRIDAPTIRAIVRNLLGTGSSSRSPQPTGGAEAPAVLDVVNASYHKGLGASVENAFTKKGFTAGAITNASSISQTSTIYYGTGALAAAQGLADKLGLTAEASDTVNPGTVQLTIGMDFPANDWMDRVPSGRTETTTATPTPVTTVAATATGTQAPVPQDLSTMSANGTPCVK